MDLNKKKKITECSLMFSPSPTGLRVPQSFFFI
jgi:hypothetical protein